MTERIAYINHPLLSCVKALYENAFPPHERRTWEALLRVLNEPRMHLNAIMDNETFAGFVIYWYFQEWLYLEHLAIVPELRGRQYGRKIIEYLKGTKGMKLILETELPHNEEATRRISFYEKQGLKTISNSYKQPPYRKEESPFAMMLMATEHIDIADYDKIVNLIRSEVYEKFY